MDRRNSEAGYTHDMKWFVTIIATVVLIFLYMADIRTARAEEPIGSRLTGEETETLIRLHNKARADVGVGPLVWLKSLAEYAQSWADHLAATRCRIEHRPYSGKWKQRHGENLFVGTSGYYGVADAVKAWESEKSLYHGKPLNSSNWYPSGHYTQMVWRSTSHIGCAKAECGGNVIIVCNYDPPGNVLGQKPY